MPKETAVSQELVFQIASELLSRDETPSVVAIQRELTKRGGAAGGTAVVARMLSKWRQNAAERLSPAPRVRPDTPPQVVQLADQMSDALFDLALKSAEESYQAKREELAARNSQIEGEMVQIRAEMDALSQRLKDAQKDLANTTETLSSERARSASLEARLEVALQREVELKSDIATLQERVLHLEADKERLQAEHILQLAEESGRHQAAIESERAVWQGERQHLHEQTDRLRQASRQREDDLTRQLAVQTEFAEQYRTQAFAANQTAGKWQGQAESAKTQIEVLQKQLSEMVEQKARAEARNERLDEDIKVLQMDLGQRKDSFGNGQ